MLGVRGPVLVEKSHKELLHGHLADTVYVEVGKNARDVVEENFIAADNVEIGGLEILIVVVQNVGYSVHRHRGLSRACGTLHYHAFVGGLSYNIILFLLYRGDNLAENSFLILGEVFV